MKQIEVECDKCGGKAKMPLPEQLQETLELVPRGFKGITSYDIQRRIPNITANAQNNRLERLRKAGLVARHRVGKFWHYTRTNCETDSPKTFAPTKAKKSTR